MTAKARRASRTVGLVVASASVSLAGVILVIPPPS
jgi:hypothetical protein